MHRIIQIKAHNYLSPSRTLLSISHCFLLVFPPEIQYTRIQDTTVTITPAVDGPVDGNTVLELAASLSPSSYLRTHTLSHSSAWSHHGLFPGIDYKTSPRKTQQSNHHSHSRLYPFFLFTHFS